MLASAVVVGGPTSGWISTHFSDVVVDDEHTERIKRALHEDIVISERLSLHGADMEMGMGPATAGVTAGARGTDPSSSSSSASSPRSQGIASVSKTGESVVWTSKEDCYLGVTLDGGTGNVVLAAAVAEKLLVALHRHFEERLRLLGGGGAVRRGKRERGKGGGRFQKSHAHFSLAAVAIERCEETLGLMNLLVPGGVLTRLDNNICESMQREWTLLQSS